MTTPTNKHRETANEIVTQWRTDRGQVVKYERMESDIATALTNLEADALARGDKLAAQIDAFWQMLHSAWDIEPREFFESEIAKGIGFSDSPLAMAVHYMWKRKAKADKLTAFARGRAEAKAEDAEIARHASVFGNGRDPQPSHDKGWFDACMHIADAVLASSPGPSYEERVRAEIAEAVKVIPTERFNPHELTPPMIPRSAAAFKTDVLAIVERGRERSA